MEKSLKKFASYFAAVQYLEKLARNPLQYDYTRLGAKDATFFLERTRHLLKLLGDPHRGFKYIHISGTAGKGTVTMMLHNILRRWGKRVGSFTSPFASASIEKIRVDGRLISPVVFARLVNKIKPAVETMKASRFGRPSYFECFFCLALLYFKIRRCQRVVLEVGLGGSFDATNVISRSQVSAITNIGLDHTNVLGKTLTKIAADKAGIIKANSHFFTTETRPRLLKIFKDRCSQLKTRFHKIMPLQPSPQPSPCLPAEEAGKGEGVRKSYLQIDQNIILATAIARHLRINDKIIARGIAETKLPCRFEIIQKNPLVILDGAHNPLKIKSVIHNLGDLTYAKLYIIFACAANKDARRMIETLTGVAGEIIFTQFYSDREAYAPEKLFAFAKNFRRKKIDKNPESALVKTLKKMKRQDALLVTGSFYLAGEARKRWVPEEVILAKRAA